MVDVYNISKNYGNHEAIHNINFKLNKGEITAFLGPNGAGKSTTMNVIAGIIAPTSGKVLVGGQDIIANPVEVKRNIGYLPEYNALYEDMYVREYLEYVASVYLSHKEVKLRVKEMIEAVNLESQFHKKISSLSNGNKRRVGLAQALIHDPLILILDEPSNGLDPNQHVKMMELLVELGRSKVILYSSHRFDDVSDIASHYLLLNKGKLVFDGRANEVLSIKELFYTHCQ